MKLKLLASVAAAGLFAAGTASADPNGWYGAVDAGWHSVKDVTAVNATSPRSEWDIEVDDGFAAFARLGYRLDANWRVELEGGYRSGEIVSMVGGFNSICQPSAIGPCGAPDGDMEVGTLMVNTIYDFGSRDSSFRPFLFQRFSAS